MPNLQSLTDREQKVLKVLEALQNEQGYPPSFRQIGEMAGIKSTSHISYCLDRLQKKGFIERDANKSRSIRILKKNTPRPTSSAHLARRVPMLGRIQAGMPVPTPSSDFALYDDESALELSENFLPKTTGPVYALEVRGNSMRDAQIMDGDIVIMQSTEQIKNGDMVAAWIRPDGETTLKHYFLENGRVRLQPANPDFQPIYVDPKNVDIQGLVVLVIRQPNRLML